MFANDPKRTYQRTRLRAHGDQEDFDCAAIMKIAITVIGFFSSNWGLAIAAQESQAQLSSAD
jgi:hypothetical protein